MTFYASDGVATDSEVVSITVNNVNQAPVLAAIGAQTVDENTLLTVAVSATDADGTTPTLTTSTPPTGAAFTDNGNGTGSFTWTPTFAQSGVYSVTFYASDGVATDSEVVSITVNNVNQPPVLAAIGAQTVDENTLLTVAVSASDADGTTPTLTTSTPPTGAAFTDNGNGTGSFTWTPTFAQSGVYSVTFYASDGVATDSEIVSITVNNVNQAPVLAAIGAQSTPEGVLLSFGVSASDADGTTPTLTTSTLPTGSGFTDNGNGTGSFSWIPTLSQSGIYPVTFYASDGAATDSEVVTITVTNSNQPPVLAAIGAQTVDENTLLTVAVSASDADGTTPTLTTSTPPTGAAFTDNGNGTGSFTWTPTFAQSGVYSVTFYASDGLATDSEVVSITVNNVNQPPVLAAIGAQSTTENVPLSFGVSGSDADGTTPTLTTSTLPTGAAFADNGDGTGTFNWTPTFTQSGVYPVTFYVSDGVAVDSEVVSITVIDAGNQPPVLAAIGAQSTSEGVLLAFGVTASDADGTTPTLTTSTLPTGAGFTDNGNGTGSFTWTPTLSQAGTYPVTFYASDGVAIDSEVVTITVTNTNQPPVLAAIGAQTVDENSLLTVAVSATDADGTTPTLTTSTPPTGATFTDNGNGTGTFNWTPTFAQSGIYSVTFYASDGVATDSEVVSITVNNVNQAPILAAIGAQSGSENTLLTFGVTASDADGTTPALTTSTLPTGAGFTDNGNGTATFSWTPTFAQSGVYSVTFYASDGVATDSEVVSITINNVNQAPILAAIGAQTVNENTLLTVPVSATDPDGTTPALTTSTLPTGAGFTDNGNGTGSLSWTPTFAQSGVYSVTFYASDGSATDSEVVSITVNNVNQAPILAAIGPRSTTENIALNFAVTASDADGTTPTLTSSTLPAGASYTDNGNGTASFAWTPTFLQSGVYSVTFYASDGVATDSEIVAITVIDAGNQLPVLASIGTKTLTEGVNLNFAVSATDAESTPTFTTSALPSGATFIDNGNGTGTFDWTPNFSQAGGYTVTFRAIDDSLAVDSEVVIINVLESGNQRPVIAAISNQTTTEGVDMNFAITATDPDGTTPVVTSSALPSGATFTPNGGGTATFDWTPSFVQAGIYPMSFYATDGVLTDTVTITITVNEAGNQAPILAAIGAQSTTENVALAFGVSATDPDGTTPTFSTSTLPTGALFTDNGNGTGSFSWTPTFTQAGTYNVTFRATDGTATDSEVVTITVLDAGNQPPILAAIGPQGVTENVLLTFGVSATDADGTIPTFSTSTLPTGALFTDNGNGTGSFNWTPDFAQAGVYNITFRATDGIATDSEVVTVTVADAGNQAPVLASIGPRSVTESLLLTFGVSATDADGTTPSLTTSTLPAGAVFTDNGNGTGTFSWTPGFSQAGLYNITFRASDGVAVDSEIVPITVLDAGNQPPVLAAIGPQSTTENLLLTFGVSATDPDGTTPTLSTSTLPSGAVFTNNGNGTGTFNWTPDFTQAGSYDVTFRASDGVATDSEVVTITVLDAGNQAPVLAAIGSQATTENVLLSFGVSATDPDGTIPTLTTSTLPTGAGFTDNGNGSGTFNWTPDFLQAGSYSVTFYASDGVAIDSEVVAITVLDAGNQPPVLAAIGARSTTEQVLLTFGVSATDPDGTTPTLSTSTLPTGAAFTDNGNGTGTFDWTPDFAQAGSYSVTFYASDGVAVDSEVVPITVADAGNQAPILAAIGAQSTTENVLLSFGVSATDPDSTIPSFTTSALPTGASFIDNGNGTGTFNWTPGFTQAGSYNVTFRATDGVAVDSEVVTITVLDAGNQSPVLAAIGAQATTENVLLTVAVSATDPDGTIPALTTSTLPTGATFVDNTNGTGSFNWTPDFTQAGSYSVTFYASDGVAIDSEIVAITVADAGNQAPVLATIGSQATTEEVLLAFGVTATDADGTIPALTTSTLPSGAAFTDNGDGSGSFNWTPDFTQAGAYSVTFYASDGVAIDSEVVPITVADAGNQAPVLATIGAQATTENIALAIAVSATDADGTIPALTTSTLPTGATFIDHNDGTGSFDWTPDFAQAGSYSVTFYASDGVAVDSEVVPITVADAGNQAPVLAAIGAQSTTENVPLTFGATATDADGTIPTLSTSTLPTGAMFVDNGNGTGTFDWTPTFVQSGNYPVTFYASDGVALDSEIVTITVIDAGNQLPVLAAIGAQAVLEGVNLNFATSATDAESIPVLTTTTLPTGATFVDNGDGTGTFDWTPDFLQAGSYSVTFYATDDSLAVDSEVVAITVGDAGNQPPVLAAIGAQSTTENIPLTFGVTATDPDGNPITLTTSVLPTGATFVDNTNGTGTFDWTPDYTQSGSYDVTFYASDGFSLDSEIVTVTVIDAGNQPPVLTPIGAQTTSEGVQLLFPVTATDLDNVPTLSTSTLPLGAVFTDSGNGLGAFDWTPDFQQAGSYDITFYASDGVDTDSELVTITVTESGNQPPVIDSIPAQTVQEGTLLTFPIVSTDPDGTTPTLTSSSVPAGATFTPAGDGTGTFTWTPSYAQAGVYTVRFFASDGVDTDTAVVTITVVNTNRPPILAAIGPKTAEENKTLLFNTSASDSDGTVPVMTATDLPTGATYVDHNNGTGTFTWRPNFGQSGVYTVTFAASDGTAADSEVVTITVVTANQPPVLNPIGPQTVVEGGTLTVNISASDPDGPPPAILVLHLPDNSNFTDNGDGTAVFVFNPSYVQSGLVYVTFEAYDGLAIDKEVVLIQVYEAGNQAPQLDSIPSPSVTEGQSLTGAITATDPEGSPVTFSLVDSTVPANFTFVDSGNGVASYTFNPGFSQSGTYNVEVIVSDGSDSTTTTITFTVIEAGNQPPVLNPIADQTIGELHTLAFDVSATDPDAQAPHLTAAPLPGTATFTDHNNGTATFNWAVGAFDSGNYDVWFYAIDSIDAGLIDSQIVHITVVDTNRTPNYFVDFNGATINEGDSLSFLVYGTDPDSTIPLLSAYLDGTDTLATNMTFHDSLNGVGLFIFKPSYTQGGAPTPTFYNVRFRVTDAVDPSLFRVSNNRTIQVVNVNAPPTISFLSGNGPFTIVEGTNLAFDATAVDIDGTVASFNVVNLPLNATFDGLVNYKTFSFSPDFTQAGVYNLMFVAVDNLGKADTSIVNVTVTDAGNQPPAYTTPLSDTTDIFLSVGADILIHAVDPEGQGVTITATSPLPANASFFDSGNGSAVFSFYPDASQDSSVTQMVFIATDPVGSADTMTTEIRVLAFKRGDIDSDTRFTMNDIVFIINYLYRDGPAPTPMEAADVDMSGSVNVADIAYLVNYMYKSGPRPPQ